MGIANEEWEKDAMGHAFLDKSRFKQSWFQLADLWTETLDPEEYAEFLRDLLECMTMRVKGVRIWREDDEVESLAAYRKRRKLWGACTPFKHLGVN